MVGVVAVVVVGLEERRLPSSVRTLSEKMNVTSFVLHCSIHGATRYARSLVLKRSSVVHSSKFDL